jgi:hypothetical protein
LAGAQNPQAVIVQNLESVARKAKEGIPRFVGLLAGGIPKPQKIGDSKGIRKTAFPR